MLPPFGPRPLQHGRRPVGEAAADEELPCQVARRAAAPRRRGAAPPAVPPGSRSEPLRRRASRQVPLICLRPATELADGHHARPQAHAAATYSGPDPSPSAAAPCRHRSLLAHATTASRVPRLAPPSLAMPIHALPRIVDRTAAALHASPCSVAPASRGRKERKREGHKGE